jgi:hypothetical protein
LLHSIPRDIIPKIDIGFFIDLNMKKLLSLLLLAFPVVAQSQDLTLVCNVVEETNFHKHNESVKKQVTNTYVFKDGQLMPKERVSRKTNWTESSIHVGEDVKGANGFEYLLVINIDRISGKISGLEHRQFSQKDSGWVTHFEGTCTVGKKRF